MQAVVAVGEDGVGRPVGVDHGQGAQRQAGDADKAHLAAGAQPVERGECFVNDLFQMLPNSRSCTWIRSRWSH